MLRSTLRRKSMFWPPIQEAKVLARRKYAGTNKRQKWEFECIQCKSWFKSTEVEVDHIVECGSLKTLNDLPGFVERLFCSLC